MRKELPAVFESPAYSLGISGDFVLIEIKCSGLYEAQVLLDDLRERSQAGQRIVIELMGHKK